MSVWILLVELRCYASSLVGWFVGKLHFGYLDLENALGNLPRIDHDT